jgi:hypothetical protein
MSATGARASLSWVKAAKTSQLHRSACSGCLTRGVLHPKACLRKRKVCSRSKRLTYERQRSSRFGASPSGPCHHSHSTRGLRRLSPRGSRSTSTTSTRVPTPRWVEARGFRDLRGRRPSDASRRRPAPSPLRNRRPRRRTVRKVRARCSGLCTSSWASEASAVACRCVRADRRGSDQRRSDAPPSSARGSGTDIPQAPAAA